MSSGFVRFFVALVLMVFFAACGGGGSSSTPSGSTGAIPVALAGLDQNVTTNSVVTLDGSASAAPDESLLNYVWIIVSKPEGSQASLSSPLAVKPTFVTDRDGTYVIALVVTTGSQESQESLVTVTATTGNSIPVANAGTTQNVASGSLVTLDGTTSSDADSALLTYAWSFVSKPAGSIAALSDAAAAKPTFTTDVAGDYVLHLVVNDGTSDSNAVVVTVTAGTTNSAPVSNAGTNQNVATGSLVTLDGSNSNDADSNPLTYSWSFVSKPIGSAAVLSVATAAKPTFTADMAGEYVLRLVVNDGKVVSTAAHVTVAVATANSAPIANAGADQNIAIGSLVTLNGSGSSDANGDSLTYAWSFVSMPAGSAATLSNVAVAKPTFTADVGGNYVIRLMVSDGTADSVADTMTVTAATANSTPVASTVADQNVATGSLITLDGSGSSDADSDTLTYAWTFSSKPAGSSATISSASAVKPTFTADVDGDYVIHLIVNDGKIASAAATVTVAAYGPGSLKWKIHPGNIYTSPVLGPDGTIYVVILDSLHAINPNGTTKWERTSNYNQPTPPAVDTDGTLYVGYEDGFLRALDPADGSELWAFPINGISMPELGQNGSIYVTSYGQALCAINSDGTIQWKLDGYYTGRPSVGSDGAVYVSIWGGLGAINQDGTPKWEHLFSSSSAPGRVLFGPDGTLYINAFYRYSNKVELAAIKPDGSLKWVFDSNGWAEGDPAIAANGTIYIGSRAGNLYAVNADGSLKWSFYSADSQRVNSPAIGSDGTIYVGATNNYLYAVDPNGSENWKFLAATGNSAPAIGSDGAIYFGAASTLYSIYGP